MQREDWILIAICLAAAWWMADPREPVFSWIEQKFNSFAQRKRLSIAVVGLATLAIRLALLPWMPVPQPKVHDEFSYLLAADTFAHGRLANPPHPMWIFFDTFHVIQHPTYSSMYPPAQGAALAIGQLLGQPWVGVVLSTAAMCMAITWMLQGWMPPAWALLGGILVASRLGIFSYWMNSYWGGSVAAMAAALILGALPRILERRRSRDVAVFAVGAAILATSRPVEGFIFCIPIVCSLLGWGWPKNLADRNTYGKRVVVPLFAALLGIVAFVGYYNSKLTGNALTFPHFIEQRAYFTTPVFLWQHDKPPIEYPNPQFDDFYKNYMPSFYRTSWPAAEGQFEWKFSDFWEFFLGPALSVPFLALPWLLRDKRMRLLLVQFVISFTGLWLVVFFHPHYAAPIMASVVVLLMMAMRQLRRWSLACRPFGVSLTRMIVLYSSMIGPAYFFHLIAFKASSRVEWFLRDNVLVLLVTLAALASLQVWSAKRCSRALQESWGLYLCTTVLFAGLMLQICFVAKRLHPEDFPFVGGSAEPFRKPVERQLTALPGQHLVLVRYSKDHNSGEEYVYNEADIDRAKTVWAREIPGVDLKPLFDYFRGRDVWVFAPDEDDSIVQPYAPASR